MMTCSIRLAVAAPLVVLLGTAMALAASPEGDVTARDREVVVRLTRGGVQRFEADGSHGPADPTDVTEGGAPSSEPGPGLTPAMTAAGFRLPPRSDAARMLDTPVAAPRPGRPAAPPSRGRAPPRR